MSTPRRAALAGAALLLAGVLSGCAGDARPYPPTGVDGLTIPLPVDDPSDFVANVDNEWFPLVPGTRWTYRPLAGGPTSTAVVVDGPVVAGVRTTALRSSGGGTSTTDFYAQDRAGNVWWLGRAGEWRAGPGVGAGLAMPAHPRRGDGFAMASAGDLLVRGVVVDTDRSWTSASLGSTGEALVLMVVTGSATDLETFAPGIGLVLKNDAGLVSCTSPASGSPHVAR